MTTSGSTSPWGGSPARRSVGVLELVGPASPRRRRPGAPLGELLEAHGRLSRADGSRKPCSTRCPCGPSPAYWPSAADATWLSSITTRKSFGRSRGVKGASPAAPVEVALYSRCPSTRRSRPASRGLLVRTAGAGLESFPSAGTHQALAQLHLIEAMARLMSRRRTSGCAKPPGRPARRPSRRQHIEGHDALHRVPKHDPQAAPRRRWISTVSPRPNVPRTRFTSLRRTAGRRAGAAAPVYSWPTESRDPSRYSLASRAVDARHRGHHDDSFRSSTTSRAWRNVDLIVDRRVLSM